MTRIGEDKLGSLVLFKIQNITDTTRVVFHQQKSLGGQAAAPRDLHFSFLLMVLVVTISGEGPRQPRGGRW